MNAQPVWELSGWWRRVGAYLIDSIVIGVLMLVPVGIAFLVSGVKWDTLANDNLDRAPGQDTALGVFLGISILAVIVIPPIYYCWMMPKTNGQTVGKQALGIRVVKEDGADVTAGFAFVRQILVIELLFGVIGGLIYIAQPLDYLWALWDKKNQCLHDKIVKSRVVLAEQVVPGPDSAPPQPYFTPGEQSHPPTGYQQQPGQPYYGPLSPEGQPAPDRAPFPQAPAPPAPPSAPPPPPTPGGTSTPYTPPPGFENPVPDDDKD